MTPLVIKNFQARLGTQERWADLCKGGTKPDFDVFFDVCLDPDLIFLEP